MQCMRCVNVNTFFLDKKSVSFHYLFKCTSFGNKICLRQYKVIYLPTKRKVQGKKEKIAMRGRTRAAWSSGLGWRGGRGGGAAKRWEEGGEATMSLDRRSWRRLFYRVSPWTAMPIMRSRDIAIDIRGITALTPTLTMRLLLRDYDRLIASYLGNLSASARGRCVVYILAGATSVVSLVSTTPDTNGEEAQINKQHPQRSYLTPRRPIYSLCTGIPLLVSKSTWWLHGREGLLCLLLLRQRKHMYRLWN